MVGIWLVTVQTVGEIRNTYVDVRCCLHSEGRSVGHHIVVVWVITVLNVPDVGQYRLDSVDSMCQ